MTEIVAEAGVNHGGDLDTARKMIDAARWAEADAVKFQTYNVRNLLRKGDPLWSTLEALELSYAAFKELARHAERDGIEFMSTPGDTDSLRFLVEECGVKRIKIASDDLTNKVLVNAAAATGLPVILSTGMATMPEIGRALPDVNYDKFTLLHCVSEYPCPLENVNLRAMHDLYAFGLPVGYSDHTRGQLACIAAAAMGASVVEKHFMLDAEEGEAIDRPVSISVSGLRSMVIKIREVEKMLGSGEKVPTKQEYLNRATIRKGPDGLRGQI